jgi:hypothetical protein
MLGSLGADPLALDKSGMSAAGYFVMGAGKLNPADVRDMLLTILQSCSRHSGGLQRLETAAAATCGAGGVKGPLPLLHLACAAANTDIVQMLVMEGRLSPDAPAAGSKATPLATTIAAFVASPSPEHMNVTDFLISQGCDPVAPDVKGNTPLGTAIDRGLVELAVALLQGARYTL